MQKLQTGVRWTYMIFGTTFSHRQARLFHLDPLKTLENLLTYKFDSIRLCSYWKEIEKEKGIYDFSATEELVDLCQTRNQKIVLTIGQKAPRWSEFHLPTWAQELSVPERHARVLELLKKTTSYFKKYSCITHWQIENEPLDPSGPDRQIISAGFLLSEIEVVKKIDTRPIVATFWGNDPVSKNILDKIAGSVDRIGIDWYPKIWSLRKFLGPRLIKPRLLEEDMKQLLETVGKPYWITELQAEPWKKDLHKGNSDDSSLLSAPDISQSYQSALKIDPEAIFFWGCEYWIWKEKNGDPSYSNAIKEIVNMPLEIIPSD
ncbi:MAG: hypothetical protein ACMG6E_02145 [Candidatus Roizmanbacteria bacterium]